MAIIAGGRPARPFVRNASDTATTGTFHLNRHHVSPCRSRNPYLPIRVSIPRTHDCATAGGHLQAPVRRIFPASSKNPFLSVQNATTIPSVSIDSRQPSWDSVANGRNYLQVKRFQGSDLRSGSVGTNWTASAHCCIHHAARNPARPEKEYSSPVKWEARGKDGAAVAGRKSQPLLPMYFQQTSCSRRRVPSSNHGCFWIQSRPYWSNSGASPEICWWQRLVATAIAR